jgi:hypothetical protein
MIIIRLVCHDDPLSAAIILEIGGMVAHAEAIMPGGTIIGAFAEGGVQERALDYDGGKLKYEVLVALDTTQDMSDRFYHYMRAVIGEPYDFSGLAKFVEHFDLHWGHHVFCSALIDDALRGCLYFPRPLPIPAHEVSPRILHQMLFVRPDAKVITRDDPIFKAHISRAEKTGN